MPLVVVSVGLWPLPSGAITDFDERTIYQGLMMAPERWDGGPKMIGQFNLRFFDYDTVASQNPGAGFNNGGLQNSFFTDSRLNLAWFQTQEWSVQGFAHLKAVQNLGPYENGFLQGEGVYLEYLFTQYETANWRVWAGKFDPFFGIAWDRAPILFGQDFNSGYRLKEMIGAGGSFKLHDPIGGVHVVEGSIFRSDTSGLSTSYLDQPEFGQPLTLRPWHNRLVYGGVANTTLPQSVALSIYGDVPWLSPREQAEGRDTSVRYGVTSLPGFNYMLSFSYLAPGTNSWTAGAKPILGQVGLIATVMQAIPVSERLVVTPFVEFANFNNYQGADKVTQFLTAYLETKLDNRWTLQLTATPRTTYVAPAAQTPGQPTVDADKLYALNLVYNFNENLQVGAGVRRMRINEAWATTPGVFINYYLRF